MIDSATKVMFEVRVPFAKTLSTMTQLPPRPVWSVGSRKKVTTRLDWSSEDSESKYHCSQAVSLRADNRGFSKGVKGDVSIVIEPLILSKACVMVVLHRLSDQAVDMMVAASFATGGLAEAMASTAARSMLTRSSMRPISKRPMVCLEMLRGLDRYYWY